MEMKKANATLFSASEIVKCSFNEDFGFLRSKILEKFFLIFEMWSGIRLIFFMCFQCGNCVNFLSDFNCLRFINFRTYQVLKFLFSVLCILN